MSASQLAIVRELEFECGARPKLEPRAFALSMAGPTPSLLFIEVAEALSPAVNDFGDKFGDNREEDIATLKTVVLRY